MNSRKIKVLQVTGAMNRGGAEVMLMDIYRNISNDFHFDFLVNYKIKDGIHKGDFDDEILKKGGEIRHIGAQWDLGPIKYLKAFRKIINEIGKPDIVHIHLNAKSGIIAWAAKNVGIKKIIAHSHANLKFRGSLVYIIFSYFEFQIQKLLISKYATNYWGCSQEAINSLFYQYLQTKEICVIIKNSVDVKRFQHVNQTRLDQLYEIYKPSKETLIIGNIGRIVKHKNVAFIIEILKSLESKNIDFRFVFAGRTDNKNYLKEIIEKAIKYNIEDKVIHLGGRDDVPNIINTFDVFVGPALKEGFGLVAVEAQAAGVPCVLYTGFPKSVDMNLNLVTFLDTFNATIWADAIIASKEKKCTNKQFIQAQIASLGFDIITNVKKIEKLYKA